MNEGIGEKIMAAFELWLEQNHPKLYDRWLDAGANADFHPGWEWRTKEWLIDDEHPEVWQEFMESLE